MNSDLLRSPFTCVDSDGSLQPRSSTKIKLVYAPKVLSHYMDITYFTIQAQGSCGCAKIKCIGQSIGLCIFVLLILFHNLLLYRTCGMY